MTFQKSIILAYGRTILEAKIIIQNNLSRSAFCILWNGHFKIKALFLLTKKVFHKIFPYGKVILLKYLFPCEMSILGRRVELEKKRTMKVEGLDLR